MADFLASLGLGGAASKYHALKGKISDRGENLTGEVVKGAEVLGSAFLTAYANGYYATATTDHAEFTAGVPADLTAGVGLLALGLMGFAGKFSDTICNLGTGALSAYAARLGTNWGAQARLKKPAVTATTTTATKGAFGSGGRVAGSPPVYHPASDVHNVWNVPTH